VDCCDFIDRQFVIEKSIDKLLHRFYSNFSAILHYYIGSSRNVNSSQKRYCIIQANEFTKNIRCFTLSKKNIYCKSIFNLRILYNRDFDYIIKFNFSTFLEMFIYIFVYIFRKTNYILYSACYITQNIFTSKAI